MILYCPTHGVPKTPKKNPAVVVELRSAKSKTLGKPQRGRGRTRAIKPRPSASQRAYRDLIAEALEEYVDAHELVTDHGDIGLPELQQAVAREVARLQFDRAEQTTSERWEDAARTSSRIVKALTTLKDLILMEEGLRQDQRELPTHQIEAVKDLFVDEVCRVARATLPAEVAERFETTYRAEVVTSSAVAR